MAAPSVWSWRLPPRVWWRKSQTLATAPNWSSPARSAIYEQGPYGSQPGVARPTPPAARYGDTFSPVGQPWPGSPAERLAQNTAVTEIIRPGVPAAQGTQPSNVPPTPESANPLTGIGSPFDPSQFRLPTLGLPPGLGTPEPTPEIQREYGQFVEARNPPRKYDPGRRRSSQSDRVTRKAAPHLHSR